MTGDLRQALRHAIDQHRRRVVLSRHCAECDKPLEEKRARHRARFCGDPCRQRWWRQNTPAGKRWLETHGNRSRRQRARA